jgi:CheY-like chemotaxis protein
LQELAKILKDLNILYAEDNPSIQATTARTLELLFANVYLANDGVEALEIYKNKKIDVVLLDYIMPNIDGYEVAKEIKRNNKNTPIIIASGYTDKEKLFNLEEFEIAQFLEKPLKYDELISALKKVSSMIKTNKSM